jgi:hypothetical protein
MAGSGRERARHPSPRACRFPFFTSIQLSAGRVHVQRLKETSTAGERFRDPSTAAFGPNARSCTERSGMAFDRNGILVPSQIEDGRPGRRPLRVG